MKGGARGVMVIVVGNGHSDTSSNPGRDILLIIHKIEDLREVLFIYLFII